MARVTAHLSSSGRSWSPVAGGLSLLLAGCFSTAQLPSLDGPQLPAPDPGRFPHEVFDAVLKAYVDGQGRVDYVGLAQNREALIGYLDVASRFSPLSDPDLFPSEADALAYWINVYNAYVLFAVSGWFLDGVPSESPSVNDDKANFFFYTKYLFGGEEFSLRQLENEVIRTEFEEPRTHFVLNCASISCPELPAEAFRPEDLESQLAKETLAFCSDSKNARVEHGTVRMSEVFRFYADDFETSGGPVAFCRTWGRNDLPLDAEVRFIPYDWSLNIQTGKEAKQPTSSTEPLAGFRVSASGRRSLARVP